MDAFFKDRKYIEVNHQVPYYSKRTKLSKKDHDNKRNYRLRRRSIRLYMIRLYHNEICNHMPQEPKNN